MSEPLCLPELFSNTKKYCVNCRQDLCGSTPLRCSRCRVVHYCTRECQKSNFSLHKSSCKKIDTLRKQLSNNDEAISQNGDGANNNEDERKACQYDLAYTILNLGYRSTDTIDRGKYIYECALLEYYKLLRQDPLWIGACESVVLLLSMLGYDHLCTSLIHFMLYPSPSKGRDLSWLSLDKKTKIRQFTEAASDVDIDLWIFGSPSGATFELSQYDTFRDIIPKQWGTNTFLIPLMLIKMRQQTSTSSRGPTLTWELEMETIEICRQAEYSAQYILPFLRSFFPDSRQRWGKSEVCALLADVDYRKMNYMGDNWEEDQFDFDDTPRKHNPWENSCETFWMMLKDCYAFTPGILDVLEETIDKMMELGINVTPEDPPGAPTTDEFTDFISYMTEKQRNGTL